MHNSMKVRLLNDLITYAQNYISYICDFRWSGNPVKLNSHNCEIPVSNLDHDVRPNNFGNSLTIQTMQGRIAPFIEEIKIDYMKENIIELGNKN
jgi:hypothetical protein